MALVCSQRTSGLFLLLFLIKNTFAIAPPWILSVQVVNKTCFDTGCAVEIQPNGDSKYNYQWSITYQPAERGEQCSEFQIRNSNVIELEYGRKVYFCAKGGNGVWYHQGESLYLEADDVSVSGGRPTENEADGDEDASRLSGNENKINVLTNINLESFETDDVHGDLENDVNVNENAVPGDVDDVIIDANIAGVQKERLEKFDDATGVVHGDLENDVNVNKNGVPVNEEDVIIDANIAGAERERLEDLDDATTNVVHGDLENDLNVNENAEPDDLDDVIIDANTANKHGIEKERLIDELDAAVMKNVQEIESNYLDSNSRMKRQVENPTTETTEGVTEDKVTEDKVTEDKVTEDKVTEDKVTNKTVKPNEVPLEPVVYSKIKLLGLRVEESAKEPKIVDGDIPSVLRETKFALRLFGQGFTRDTVFAFTHTAQEYGTSCEHLLDDEFKVQIAEFDSAFIEMLAPAPTKDYKFYFCMKNSTSDTKFIHQGSESWKVLATHNKLLPLWASLVLIVILLMLASLFSGLNLGLMALDRTELKIIANTGTEKERKYARAIMPVRAHGNYLLCTILLSNVAVNSTFTVILDDLTSGLVAVIGSTLAIVFIAEITPQAICARHGLFVGAKSIWIMKIVMGICAPLAWPTSKLLDYFLGEEIGTHYNRERLKELVKVTNHVNDLDKEEVNIISGALDLRKKCVRDVMTKLKDCFMLPINSVLDFETMSEIVKSGYSRIPVYEGHRGNIVTVLFIKDLAFVDPDDNTPLRTLCQYYQNPCNFVFEDVTLDVMLKQFKEGHKGHMAFVQRIDREGDGDPTYETVGLVTLEDVIEEMIQAEIVDETDVISDNRTKKRLMRPLNKFQDLAAFAGHQNQRVHVSPQLIMATFQFLTASVDAFRPENISEAVLRRLLKQDVIHHIKLRLDEDKNDPKRYVFQEGKPVDYFVLILEGRVEVTVGRENLVFEAGPFTYFGVQALTQNVGLAEAPSPSNLGSLQNLNMDSMLRHTFVPDYSVRAITELYYLTVKRSLYLAAKRATLMEKGAITKGGTNEQIEPEVDKLLREGDKPLDDHVIRDDVPNTQAPPKPFTPTSPSHLLQNPLKRGEKEKTNPEEEKLLNSSNKH